MRYDLIKTNEYLLICDDSEIKDGDKVLYNNRDILTTLQFDTWFTKWDFVEKIIPPANYIRNCKKIIAHLPLNGAPVLEGVPVLSSLSEEDDVKELFKEEYEQARKRGSQDYAEGYYGGLLDGYEQARKKYKYTEFNIITAFEYGWNQRHYGKIDENELLEIEKRFIQSLQQPTPIGFECEMAESHYVSGGLVAQNTIGGKGLIHHTNKSIKTITNSEGRVEWVGKYIYE
jgi:hypothetical protein